MRTYAYKGFDGEGRPRKGLVEAASVKEARKALAGEGILAERISQGRESGRFAVDARGSFYRGLSSLLEAGVPLVRALDMLIESGEVRGHGFLLATVRDRVREGSSLAAALSAASGKVTAFEVAIVEAAERSATVGPSLDRLADFLEESERLRERVQGALIYPTIVVGVGIIVAVVMLGLLVPRTQDILASGGGDLPRLTSFMMGMGQFLFRWGAVVALLIVLGGVVLRGRIRGDADLRRRLDARLFRLPVVGRGYGLLANLRFAKTLAILLEGGTPLIDAMRLAGRATGSEWLAEMAERESDSVRQGSRLSDAVNRIPPLSDALPGWLRIGEAGGGMARLLERAAAGYEHRWNRFVTRCLALLEPLIILVIGGFVLLVTLSVLLPVISLTKTIGGGG